MCDIPQFTSAVHTLTLLHAAIHYSSGERRYVYHPALRTISVAI